MLLTEYLDQARDSAIRTKKWACKPHDRADIHPYIEAYRGEHPVAVVTLQHHIREEILECAAAAAFGLDADLLSMTFETWVAKSPMNQPLLTGINPVTGKVWQQGEMDDVARNHDGVAKGWVSEALSVCVANRAGDVLFTMAPFRYVGVKNALVFDDKPDSAYTNENSSENRAQGYMPDVLRRAMLHASASVHFPASFADYDRTDRDVATMKLMASRFECAPALITSTADDPERLRRMKEFGRLHGNTMRFERPRDWRV